MRSQLKLEFKNTWERTVSAVRIPYCMDLNNYNLIGEVRCDVKMRDIRAKNYDIFQDCESPTRRKELITAMGYIDQLGGLTQQDISYWSVLDIFKNPNSEKDFIHSDKNKINTIFFEELKRVRDGAPLKVTKMNESEKRRVVQAFKEFYQNEKYRIEELINSSLRMSRDHHNEYIKNMRQSIEAHKLKDSLRDTHLSFVTQVDDIIAGSYIQFVSKAIILSHTNAQQAIDMTVPLGHFLLRIHLDSPHVVCYPYDDHYSDKKDKNTVSSSNGYWHPHVDRDGRICFGTMLNDFNKAMSVRDFVKVAKLCKAVLTKYYHENPFTHLYRFRDAIDERLKREQAKEEKKKAGGSTEESVAAVGETVPAGTAVTFTGTGAASTAVRGWTPARFQGDEVDAQSIISHTIRDIEDAERMITQAGMAERVARGEEIVAAQRAERERINYIPAEPPDEPEFDHPDNLF